MRRTSGGIGAKDLRGELGIRPLCRQWVLKLADDCVQRAVLPGSFLFNPGHTHDLLARVADPDDATIREAIGGTLCRCTGYGQIIEAVRLAAARLRQAAPLKESAG